jgi:hypothetical protein
MFRGRRERERKKNEPMIMGKVVNLSVAVPIRSGEKVTQKKEKKNPEANQICWNLLLLLFGIEGSRRKEKEKEADRG